MLNFAQSVSAVRKAGVTARSFSGNATLSGSVLSVVDAVTIMERMLAERRKLDPSIDVVNTVNQMARSSQWSAAVGAEAARVLLARGKEFGGGYSPGFSGPGKGNIDKGE